MMGKRKAAPPIFTPQQRRGEGTWCGAVLPFKHYNITRRFLSASWPVLGCSFQFQPMAVRIRNLQKTRPRRTRATMTALDLMVKKRLPAAADHLLHAAAV